MVKYIVNQQHDDHDKVANNVSNNCFINYFKALLLQSKVLIITGSISKAWINGLHIKELQEFYGPLSFHQQLSQYLFNSQNCVYITIGLCCTLCLVLISTC